MVVALGLGVQPARALDPTEAALMHRINAARDRAGCRPLKVGARVSRRAEEHSARMAYEGYVYHSDLARMLAGVRWSLAAENVGAVSLEPTAELSAWEASGVVHRAFMRSARHRRNLLDCRMRRVGVGVVRVESTWWATEVLWRR